MLVITVKKNFFPAKINDPIIKHYLDKACTTPTNPGKLNNEAYKSIIHFKLPYLNTLAFTQRKIKLPLRRYCTDLQIRLAFFPYKVSNMFSITDPIPISLCSLVVYNFSCAGCNSVYVGKTCRCFSSRVCEHLARDNNSYIYKHLNCSTTCRKLYPIRTASPSMIQPNAEINIKQRKP